MSAYEDEDGIDGPFNRAMDRAMKEDAKGVTPAKPQDPATGQPITAERPHCYIHRYAECWCKNGPTPGPQARREKRG